MFVLSSVCLRVLSLLAAGHDYQLSIYQVDPAGKTSLVILSETGNFPADTSHHLVVLGFVVVLACKPVSSKLWIVSIYLEYFRQGTLDVVM